jgi:glycerol-3-phosphate dehydrogenase
VHIVLPRERLPLARAITLISPVDGRVMFALPWRERSVLGTTDTDYDGTADDVAADADDVKYLCDSGNGYFPGANLAPSDVIATWAGLRPLIAPPPKTEEGVDESSVSREHEVFTRPDGLVIIAGGKLTTYRRMAQDALDAVVRAAGLDAGPCTTARLPLAGAAPRAELARLAEAFPSPRLVRRFGTDAGLVLAAARDASGLPDEDLLAPVAAGLRVTLAELVFGVTHEGAHDVADLLDRRTRLGLVADDRGHAEPAAHRACALARSTVR